MRSRMPRARAMTSSAVGLSGVLVWASVSAIGSFLLGSFGYSLLTRYVGAAAAEPAGEENRVIPPCTADAAGVHPGAEGESHGFVGRIQRAAGDVRRAAGAHEPCVGGLRGPGHPRRGDPDALQLLDRAHRRGRGARGHRVLRSEEHTSELQSLM